MTKTLKIFIHVFAGLFGISAILFGVAAWRLSTGPVSIAFLSPYIEDAFGADDLSYRLKFEDTVLIWNGWGDGLDIIITKAALIGNNEKILAAAPKISLGLSSLALFEGDISITRIELLQPVVYMARQDSGGIQFAFGQEFDEPDEKVNGLISEFFEPVGANHRFGRLERVGIVSGSFYIKDDITALNWESHDTNLSFDIYSDKIDGNIAADVTISDYSFHLIVETALERNTGKIKARVEIAEVIPAKLAASFPDLSLLKKLHMPVSGEILFGLDEKGALVDEITLDLAGGEGVLKFFNNFSEDVGIKSFNLLGRSNSDFSSLQIDRLSIGTLGPDLSLKGKIQRNLANNKSYINIEFEKITPSELAYVYPGLEKLGGLELPLSGALAFNIDEHGSLVKAIDFDLTSEGGHLNFPDLFPTRANVSLFQMRGSSTIDLSIVNIENIYLDVGGPEISFNGVIREVADELGIEGLFEFKEMPFKELGKYWPHKLMPNARKWMLGNVHDGVISSFTVNFDIEPGDIKPFQKGMRPAALSAAFTFRDTTVNYLTGQPFARGIEGEGFADGARLFMEFWDGYIQDIYVASGSASVEQLMQSSATATVIANLTGANRDAMRLLDGPRFRYARKFGLNNKVGGTVNAEIGVRFPFKSKVELSEIELAGFARLMNFELNNFLGSYDISEGESRVAIDKNNMDVMGNIAINGIPSTFVWKENFDKSHSIRSKYVISSMLDDSDREALKVFLDPYISGMLGINIDYIVTAEGVKRAKIDINADNASLSLPELFWTKPFGQETSLSALLSFDNPEIIKVSNFKLDSASFFASGNAKVGFDDGNIISAQLGNLKFDDNDLKVAYRTDVNNNMYIKLSGKSLDLRPYIKQLLDSDGESLPPFVLEIDIERLITHADQQITQGSGKFINTPDGLETALLRGTLVSGSGFQFVLEREGRKRKLSVRSEDAGSVARAFNIYDNAIGGYLLMDAILHDDEPGRPVVGEVRVKDYRVINAPTLAHILAIASFTGIFESLQGEGLAFSTFKLPFTLKDKKLTFKNAQTSGLSIGLNASGNVNLDTDNVYMEGTIVPAYLVNSFLGNIPVVGDLLVGGKGEGIFAANFSVQGTTEEPDIVVNPLSVLAPGFLRNLFPKIDRKSIKNDNEPQLPQTR